MRDAISAQRVKLLHPKITSEVEALIDKAESGWPLNIAVRVVQGLRTIEEQDNLYALGRTKVNPDGRTAKKPLGNIVTNAKGGSSLHNYGLAIDYAILYDKDKNGNYEELSWSLTKDEDRDGVKDWDEVKNIFVAAGYEWGGSWRTFKDYPHLQKTFGKTLAQLRALYKPGEYVKI